MESLDWKIVIFVFFLIDSIGAIILSFVGPAWWPKYFAPLAKWFPAAKGWSLVYLAAVLLVGYLVFL
jgi:hypothetical protein